jgi:hypothetical protein
LPDLTDDLLVDLPIHTGQRQGKRRAILLFLRFLIFFVYIVKGGDNSENEQSSSYLYHYFIDSDIGVRYDDHGERDGAAQTEGVS